MRPDPLILFPLAAFALALLYPIFDRRTHKTVSRSLRSRKRRLLLLGRASVVTMLCAAMAADVWPWWPHHFSGKALQALLICLVVLVPPIVAHGAITWRHSRGDARRLSAAKEAALAAHETLSRPEPRADGSVVGVEPGRRRTVDGADDAVAKPVTAAAVAAPVPRGPKHRTIERAMSAQADDAAGDDDDDVVSEQLARLTTLVDSIDLGRNGRAPAPGATPSAARSAALSRSVVPPRGRREASGTSIGAVIAEPSSTERELTQLDDGEIAELVDTLRGDKRRLQTLVIAQRAAHESERRAHERTRAVARNVVRTARESQKLARYERRERLHAEAKYERVARALKNAVSTIQARQDGRTPAPVGGSRPSRLRVAGG